jgi:hypothetical protein
MALFTKLKINWLGFAQILLFCAPFAIYLQKYQAHAIGADFLLRITEARYFLAGINPYDVFMGLEPIISAYGPKPAAYSFFSYFFAGLFTKISSNQQTQLLIFICLDFAVLVAGIGLVNKMTQSFLTNNPLLAQPPQKNWVLMFVLVCSTYFWQHVYFLNYTLLSVLGLLFVILGLSKKLTLLPLLGMALIGLRPSLAIPVFVFLIVGKHFKLLALASLEYFCVLGLASVKLQVNPIELIKQLSEVQRYFSDNLGYHHAEGILLILKTQLGSYVTVVSTLIVALILFAYRKNLANPLVSIILIISCSVSLFYTQVHAWVSVYPVLLIALASATFRGEAGKRFWGISNTVVLILIAFVILPRLSSYIAEEHRYYYLVVQNLVRFGALWWCAIYLIKQILVADKLTASPHHA